MVTALTDWIPDIPEEMRYVLLLFVLFVIPRVLQRIRLPSAITSAALGAAAGMGFGLFRHDPAVNLLSALGIVSLFLFAGLDVDFHELRQSRAPLLQHLAIRVGLLALVGALAHRVLRLPGQPAVLLALALTTPSAGFILDSLGSLGVSDRERSWVKSKAIATELLALLLLFFALQPPRVERVAVATLVLGAAVAILPLMFRLFAAIVLPYAPKSEFAFLLMLAVMTALVTRALGAYYLIGAFVVGLTAQRFREHMPGMASEQMIHAVEVFASFFVPFYFFHAGVELPREAFTVQAAVLGLGFVAVFVPLRVGLIALHRRLTFGEPLRHGARIGVAMAPTLVFTLVIAEMLRERFALPRPLFGALMVYALVNTVLPGFALRVPPPAFEELHALSANPAVGDANGDAGRKGAPPAGGE